MGKESSPIKKFVLPEKDLSLKLIFDNARNYVIVGAFIAMARWFSNEKIHVPALSINPAIESFDRTVFLMLCVVIAYILFILNVAQSLAIIVRFLEKLSVDSEPGETASVSSSVPVTSLERILKWFAFALTFIFLIILARMGLYIVWFSATGNGH